MAEGGYTPAQIRAMTYEEVLFIYHYQNLAEDRRFSRLAGYLGVIWDLDELARASNDAQSGDTKKVFIPLSMVIRPEIMDYLKQQSGTGGSKTPYIGGGTYIPKSGEKVVSVGQLSKEEFKAMAQGLAAGAKGVMVPQDGFGKGPR
jgi:hypothetical protein